jgi:hypothetical protein
VEDGCLVGVGCTVGDGRLVGLGVTLPDTDAPPPQAASRLGTTPREQSLRNVRRLIACGEALSGCLPARSIGIRKSFHPTVGILSWPIHSLFFEVNGCIQSIVAPDEIFFSIYESIFPGRIRGYYLLGSYTDATSVSISDIDMAILFKGSFVDNREAQVNRCCSPLFPSASVLRHFCSTHSHPLPPESVVVLFVSRHEGCRS